MGTEMLGEKLMHDSCSLLNQPAAMGLDGSVYPLYQSDSLLEDNDQRAAELVQLPAEGENRICKRGNENNHIGGNRRVGHFLLAAQP